MSIPVVTMPDTELWLATYLRTALSEAGVFVATEVPNPRRAEMVTVRRDGGQRIGVVLEAVRVGVNVWADTEQTCADLALNVAALVVACPDGAPVVSARQQSGPSRVSDTSGQPLRYATFELVVRGSN